VEAAHRFDSARRDRRLAARGDGRRRIGSRWERISHGRLKRLRPDPSATARRAGRAKPPGGAIASDRRSLQPQLREALQQAAWCRTWRRRPLSVRPAIEAVGDAGTGTGEATGLKRRFDPGGESPVPPNRRSDPLIFQAQPFGRVVAGGDHQGPRASRSTTAQPAGGEWARRGRWQGSKAGPAHWHCRCFGQLRARKRRS